MGCTWNGQNWSLEGRPKATSTISIAGVALPTDVTVPRAVLNLNRSPHPKQRIPYNDNISWHYLFIILRKYLFNGIYSFKNCVPGINKGLLKNQRTMTVTKHTKTLISWNVIGPNASCLSFMTFFISLSFSSFGTSSSKGSSPFAYYIFHIVNDFMWYDTMKDKMAISLNGNENILLLPIYASCSSSLRTNFENRASPMIEISWRSLPG